MSESGHNTHISRSALGSWKVDPDHRQDRRSGPVVPYKLSPEEIQTKYGNIKGSGKAPVGILTSERVARIREKEKIAKAEGEDEDMSKLNISVDDLLAVCRECSTYTERVQKVAEKFGLTNKQAENQIYLKKITRLLEEEPVAKVKQPVEEMTVEEVPKEVPERITGKIAVEGPEKIAISIPETEAPTDKPKKLGLKPKSLVSKDTNYEYDLKTMELVMSNPGNANGSRIEIPWNIFNTVIEELQEIKQIVEAG